MDIQNIVVALRQERDRIDRAIAALDGTGTAMKARKSAPTASKSSKRRRSRRGHLSAAGRKRLSDLMKRRWAERRRKGAK